jgi:predicted helicase
MTAPPSHLIHEKGRLLEIATKLYFERVMPVEAVYYWRDWAHQQGLPIQDTGIDLVAIFEGQTWAIQCKLWQKEVDWSDLGTFVASLTKKDLPFAGGYLVVESLTRQAERQLEELEKPLHILSAREILNTLREEYGLSEEAILQEKPLPPKTPKTLRPYQEKAVRAAVEHFQHHQRGKLLMPPGTGKTLVSLRITEELLAHKIQSPTSPHVASYTKAESLGSLSSSLSQGENLGSSSSPALQGSQAESLSSLSSSLSQGERALLSSSQLSNGGAVERFSTPPLVLFLCPSIALLDQSIKVWWRESRFPLHIAAVVSDKTVGKEDDFHHRSLLTFPATTNSQELLERFELRPDRLNVVFSTYQSLEVVIEAQAKGFPAFDLVICDEAHRTAGVSDKRHAPEESGFRKVHDDNFLRAHKRLYMTATPKVFGTSPEERRRAETENLVKIYDMSDETLFGTVFFEYSFRHAIEEGYLAPYRVVVLMVDPRAVQKELYEYLQSDQALSVDLATQLVALGRLIQGEIRDESGQPLPQPIRSGIVFVGRVRKSEKLGQEFARVYQEYFGEPPKAQLRHIDGSMSAFEKRRRLDWLREGSAQEPHLLSNAKVLTEGIDVPSLDVVAFLDPKESVVDIIQAVGRVVRTAENKNYGLIFIPLILQATDQPLKESDVDRRLHHSSYKTLWQVLGALASLDSSFRAQIRLLLVGDRDKPLSEEPVLMLRRSPELQPELFEQVRQHLSLRIVRSFRLGRVFLRDWAQETARLAQTLHHHLQNALERDPDFQNQFQKLLQGLQKNLHPQIHPTDVQSLIVQYLLTRPIFEALFPPPTHPNPQNTHLQSAADLLEEIFGHFRPFLKNNLETLQKFYDQAQARAAGLTSPAERQEFIRQLYTDFFAVAFPQLSEEMGIAYTPLPLVQFLVRVGNHLLQEHFDRSLQDPGVGVWDPFAGTGTFLALAMNDIPPHALQQKLALQDFWATEILLLPFLVLVKNLEHLIAQKLSHPIPFSGALWGDTFQLMEHFYQKKHPTLPDLFPPAFQNLQNHFLQKPLHLILSNPPWRAGRENENQGRKNLTYPTLRSRIETTYAAAAQSLGATNLNSLYDTYIQAIRLATDRIEEGIIAFVLNNGWLTGLAARGLRNTLQSEFAAIYIYDLKGDARTRGEERRKQAENVFGDQSRAGVCLTLLVKKKDFSGKGRIFYAAVPDYASKEEKFRLLETFAQDPTPIPWREIHPSPKADWLQQGQSEFDTFLKLGDKHVKNTLRSTAASSQSSASLELEGDAPEESPPPTAPHPHLSTQEKEITLFALYCRGVITCRDRYVYNFSEDELRRHVQRLITTFNNELARAQKGEITEENVEEAVEKDPKKIKWDSTLKRYLFSSIPAQKWEEESLREAYYRPFVPMKLYFNRVFNNSVHRLFDIFPTADTENIAIVVSAVGKGAIFDAFMVDAIVDLHYFSAQNQLFPLYYFAGDGSRRENITAGAVGYFSRELGRRVRVEEVFYYVFGVLSAPGYRERYGENLLMELPRVPLLRGVFGEVVDLGRKLAALQLSALRPLPPQAGSASPSQSHSPRPLSLWQADPQKRNQTLQHFGLWYEPLEPYFDAQSLGLEPDFLEEPLKKVRLQDKERRIFINDRLVWAEIPAWVFSERVGNYAPLRWVSEYLVPSEDEETGIVWDPGLSVGEFLEIAGRLVRFSERAKALKERLNAVFWWGLSEEGLLRDGAK